ncbi:hypothetical protein BGZ63DRAFT_39907 [Mariannaea sp. PMI_226]|nr:hypothetical protein BGZ63DRAFT_39907 [Mariannaea sp. PMI_226]
MPQNKPSSSSTPQEGNTNMLAVAMPKVLSPASLTQTQAPSTLALKSEQDCRELLLREVSALPEREIPVTSQESSPTETRVSIPPRNSTKQDGTTTNVWIGRTVRSAMSDILNGS